MIWRSATLAWALLACQQYQHGVTAQQTWPASTDELEDIMFLTGGRRSRNFADPVTPCSKGAAPGRIAAAEFLRTAFHDMATANIYQNFGGLDASIVYELTSGDNVGPGFRTTLETYVPYFSSRTSMADLIAAGVYIGVRSCGGPAVSVGGGRIDATTADDPGVPAPQNAIGTFKNQFLRIGFDSTQMIQFVACGHTIGGVHTSNFPDVLPASAAGPNGFNSTDSTPSVWDNKIATEYVSGTTKDPLVQGPSISNKRNSDFVVFNSDNNVTITAMQPPDTFASVCKTMYQKMIEVVPPGVTLSPYITPYAVKPYDLQLTLLNGGSSLGFSGEIRVRTTQRTQTVAKVQLAYKDRTGATVSAPIDTTPSGTGTGLDDSFAFFSFSTTLPADKSISSFNVVITSSGGGSEVQDNNGNGFKVDDSIIFQAPQSCLSGSGNLTVFAAVRGAASSPSLQVIVKNPGPSGIIVPALSTATAAMATQTSAGAYQLYSASYTLTGAQAQSAIFGVFAGSSSDNYKAASVLPTACAPFGTSPPSSTPSSSPFAFQGCYYDAGAPRALSADATAADTMTVETCSTYCSRYQLFGLEYGRECYCGNSLDATSTIRGLSDCSMKCAGNAQQTCGAGNRISLYKNTKYTAPVSPNIPGYSNLGCYTEGSAGRALTGGYTANDNMNVNTCATYCSTYNYFGVEYGKECYCGNTINAGSVSTAASDCSYLCAGNSTQFCGAGNRLNMYQKGASAASSTPAASSSSVPASSTVFSTTSTIRSTSTVTPASSSTSSSASSTATGPSLPGYTYQGCMTDRVEARSLGAKTQGNSNNTYANCAAFCSGYAYFGVEYGRECYCGDSLANSPTTAKESDCSMPCSGDANAVCGAGNRLNVFKSTAVITQPSNPAIPGYTYAGCSSDSVGARILQGGYLADGAMTVEKCATYCNSAKYFGVEYGGECYCGASFANPTTKMPEGDCSFLCGGNKMEFCGAANRMSLWSKNA
ncbi:heme peroxidase [Polyplosphaeria fusca]|uniref:Heme peroxidase n=1 Tax=Polyplosphaeria fusca TaxID=682080 RepID=A0A9P4QWE0_9PLEO|nr:heme peroxidase [Polyplosphaeria fusca]